MVDQICLLKFIMWLKILTINYVSVNLILKKMIKI